MSLHTKYRPKTFDDVIGQDHIVQPLLKMVEDRSAQTFLLEGPSGCGKTTIARIASAMLGCEDPMEIDAATNTGVDSMRDVMKMASMIPIGGTTRCIIIDECHRLSKQAWDSMLKAIEEPAPSVFWFFCTTDFEKVPLTIVSRCVDFHVRKVDTSRLKELLDEVMEHEGLIPEEGMTQLAAASAFGGVRRALVNMAKILDAEDIPDARSRLRQTPATNETADLAKLLLKPGFPLNVAKETLLSLKGQNAESVRIAIFQYTLGAVMRDNVSWHLHVLSEFEKPVVETNLLGDIMLRIARLDFKRKKS